MSEWFVIKNFEDFIDTTRAFVFSNFGKKEANDDILYENLSQEEKNEMDQILSHQECIVIAKSMAKKQVHNKTKKTRYTISDDIYINIITAFGERMVSNILSSLVNKGLIETAYDNKANDFVFYIPDSLKKYEKPETD